MFKVGSISFVQPFHRKLSISQNLKFTVLFAIVLMHKMCLVKACRSSYSIVYGWLLIKINLIFLGIYLGFLLLYYQFKRKAFKPHIRNQISSHTQVLLYLQSTYMNSYIQTFVTQKHCLCENKKN